MENSGNSVVNGLGLATLWQNPIAVIVLSVLIFALIFLVVKAAKRGLFSFSKGGFTIGVATREREVLRTQLDRAGSAIAGFYNQCGFRRDDYRKLYIMSECEDIIYKAIAVNHINVSPTYISLKQDAIWSVICQYAEVNPSDDFHNKVNTALEKLIRELVDIRTYIYEGKNK